MKQFFTLILILCFVANKAQTKCHSTEMQQAWFEKNPAAKLAFEQREKKLAADEKEAFKKGYQVGLASKPVSTAIYTIPVVFHILHTGGNENISDAQVIDAVNILTRDFNRLNADTANVVAAFKNNIGDAKIEFQLATRDPNGNCTNGIIRHLDQNTLAWDGDFPDYLYSWPSQQYLNIYVVKSITFNAAGYTYLPGSGVPSAVDAIVVLSSYVGSIGTSAVSLSRVLTHEVGHWLNLEHTWGWNNVGTTCGDDNVSDTPLTKGFTACVLGGNFCNPGTIENVQNYMEYAYCENMFTGGQVWRMHQAMNSPNLGRDYLSTTTNLQLTGITNPGINCTPQVALEKFSGTNVCSGKSMSIKSFTWNAAPTSYSWSATTGAIISNPTSSVANVLFSGSGNVTITCAVSNSSGNDADQKVFTILNGMADHANANAEGFEDPSNILPSTWAIINPTTPAEKWMLSTVNGMNGTKCMFVPGENLSPGSVEILESPSYNFLANQGAQFSFKYAYARYSGQHNDVFKVQASKNCGNTWTDIWVPGPASLAQNSGGVDMALFQPTNSQWKTHFVTSHPLFIPFKNEPSVRFRFYFEEDPLSSGQGNRFYLDAVNFESPVGVNELRNDLGLRLYPNPSHKEINLEFTLSGLSEVSYQVLSISGAVIQQSDSFKLKEGRQHITVNEEGSLTQGIYILNLKVNGIVLSQKLIID